MSSTESRVPYSPRRAPSCRRARLARPRGAHARVALERRAADQPRGAGAALVEGDEPVVVLEPAELERHAGELAHAGAARPAGQVEQRRLAARRAEARHPQPHAAGHRARAVERHRHPRARRLDVPAALPAQPRRGGRREDEQRERGDAENGAGHRATLDLQREARERLVARALAPQARLVERQRLAAELQRLRPGELPRPARASGRSRATVACGRYARASGV